MLSSSPYFQNFEKVSCQLFRKRQVLKKVFYAKAEIKKHLFFHASVQVGFFLQIYELAM